MWYDSAPYWPTGGMALERADFHYTELTELLLQVKDVHAFSLLIHVNR